MIESRETGPRENKRGEFLEEYAEVAACGSEVVDAAQLYCFRHRGFRKPFLTHQRDSGLVIQHLFNAAANW